MKRTIRLNERDLHSIISESVRRTINEMWDDEFDSEQMEMYRQSIEADHIAKDVENGVYDDQLDQILNNGACDYFGLDTDLLEYEWITDAAVERKCVIDKDFALKYGHNPGNPNFGSDAHPSHASYMERYQGNENRFDWPSYQPALSDDYWKDAASRDLGQKLPNTFTKKGEFRKVKDLPSRFAKDLYGTDQADKRPLHRKGSLNRVGMPESRMRNIVRESVNKVLNEMGTPKQNAFLRKLMGDRYKDEYDDLSPKDSSKMIDAELANSNTPQREYEVVDTIGGKPDIYPCVGLYNAKKKLGEIVEDYYNSGWSAVGDVWLRKDSDIRWVAGGRNLGYAGSIYIRRKK